MIKVATIIGARPQFIKAATVTRAFCNKLAQSIPTTEIIIHTGQHFDDNMSEVFFRELDIREPDYNLGVGGGRHGQNTGRMIEKIEAILIDERPDWVLVYGDTDSTLAGALAGAKLHIPVAHVEAGLRSYNRIMPEEINRILTDQISTLLFCPTDTAVHNLQNEGYPHKLAANSRQLIIKVGDVMYDAALFYSDKAEKKSLVMQKRRLKSKKFVLATIHRAENTDDSDKLLKIIEGLNHISKYIPVILPLHPRTRKRLELQASGFIQQHWEFINFIEPIGYLDMVMLEKNAKVIITDSGGVQKEAYFYGVPCVTVRDETEWVELVDAGVNQLAKADKKSIVNAFHKMKDKPIQIQEQNLYGNGNSAEKIVSMLTRN